MSDREFEDLLQETLEEYGDPGATPREAMWQVVADSRRKVIHLPWWRRSVTRVDLVAGAVAALVLVFVGIQVGRMSTNPADRDGDPSRKFAAGALPTRNTEVPQAGNGEVDLGMQAPAEGRRDVMRLAANPYLSRTESFLTRWRAGDPASTSNEWTREWARRGLTDVRLLLDTAGSHDPEMKSLLLDMEVVLAQILQASAEGSTEDRDRAERRLHDRAVLPRLRNMIPVGREAAVTQGVPR